MSEFVTWLPDVLRKAGVDVYVMPGAETRTSRSTGFSPRGIVWHHTASGPHWQDGHVAALLAKGRRDLEGPLSQVGIERDGTWVIVALGRANHNGFGTWGNDSIGLEFYNDGVGEAWSAVQVESGIVGTRAILDHLKLPIERVKGHKETDEGRKIDPTLDMADIRRRIANRPTEPPTQEDDDDMRQIIKGDASTAQWITDGITKRHIKDKAERANLVLLGLARGIGASGNDPHVIAQEYVDRIITVK